MYSFRCRVWLLAVTLLGSYSLAHAGINQWTSNGPEGGTVRALAIDPVDPAILYAGITTQLWKSTDGGQSWTVTNFSVPNMNVWALAVDPLNPAHIYVGTIVNVDPPPSGAGIFKSMDGGATWTSSLTEGPGVAAFVIDPVNSQTIYAGTAILFGTCCAGTVMGPFSPGGRRTGRGGSHQATPLATFHPLPGPLPSRERGGQSRRLSSVNIYAEHYYLQPSL